MKDKQKRGSVPLYWPWAFTEIHHSTDDLTVKHSQTSFSTYLPHPSQIFGCFKDLGSAGPLPSSVLQKLGLLLHRVWQPPRKHLVTLSYPSPIASTGSEFLACP